MLSKDKRIPKQLFKKILKNKGFFAQTPLFSLQYGKEVSFKKSRFAAVVSKKNVAHASKRNTARRRMYGVLEKLYPTVAKGFYGIFYLKKGIEKTTFKALHNEVEAALTQAQILR